MKNIFYITGKSASGKDSIYSSLINDANLNLSPIILHTTRPMRDGEKEGREKRKKTFHIIECIIRD